MPADQANVEYWFRLLYECIHGGCYGPVGLKGLEAWLANLWLWIIYIGYILSIIAFLVIIYCTVRLFELRKQEAEYYSTLLTEETTATGANKRWEHVQTLIGSQNQNDWRTAIMEADIMLDDMLTSEGYVGAGVGEKLKSADPADFKTIEDAWEAHKVRNQVAHQGTDFDFSQLVAQRTIGRYENVFREFGVI